MKNKEITMYELVGLIKDNKAPKNIQYYVATFEFKNDNYYLKGKNEIEYSIFYKLAKGYMTLNDIVEILQEENDEWEDIEEFNYTLPSKYEKGKLINKDGNYNTLRKIDITILEKINQLIKNQKYLKIKLESEDAK